MPCQLLEPLVLPVRRNSLLQAIKAKSPQKLLCPRQGMTKGPESSEREGRAGTSHHLLPHCTQDTEHSSLSAGKQIENRPVAASSLFWVGGTAWTQCRDMGGVMYLQSQSGAESLTAPSDTWPIQTDHLSVPCFGCQLWLTLSPPHAAPCTPSCTAPKPAAAAALCLGGNVQPG